MRPRRPRPGLRLLVWALVLAVFGGLALLSGERFGSGSAASERAAPAAPAMPVSSVPAGSAVRTISQSAPPGTADSDTAGTAGTVFASGALDEEGGGSANDEEGGGSGQNGCQVYDENREFLPLHRWESFDLFTVDEAIIFKTRLFLSMIASLMFVVASLCWRLLATIMGFSYTFDMICLADDEINSGARTFSLYASWFLIPAWLWVLAAAIKRWTSGGNGGPASAIRLVMVFLAATGLIFFIGDQSDKHQDNPTAPYTVPWMAMTVQSGFGEVMGELRDLSELANSREDDRSVFYDSDPATAGEVSCAKLDTWLHSEYVDENERTGIGQGALGMAQLSRIWEISLVRSWMTAQFGEGKQKYPSPAHAACRSLEVHSEISAESKLLAYDRSTGKSPGTTTTKMKRGVFLTTPTVESVTMIAWGACRGDPDRYKTDDGEFDERTIPQWDPVEDIEDRGEACGDLFSSQEARANQVFSMDAFLLTDFSFDEDDDLGDKLGDCVATVEACRWDWKFASSWIGQNQAQRLLQGLMSMIVGWIFLFALGPMAIGLMLVSAALAGLAMLLPFSLILFAAGLDQGKRLLKVTGAAAAGEFVFTLSLMALAEFIHMSYSAINGAIGEAPSFFEQVLQAAAPLVGLWLFKMLARLMGVGDISKLTGALGFAGAMALKATGDSRLSRNPGARIGEELSGIGVGRRRLGALDERSLQSRILNRGFNNRATRAVTGAAARGVRRGTRRLLSPVTDAAVRGMHNLQRVARSGSTGQRAAAYGALAAAMVGLTAAAPALGLVTAPLIPVAAGAAAAKGGFVAGRAGGNRLQRRLAERVAEGSAGAGTARLARWLAPRSESGHEREVAGLVMARSARPALRQAEQHHRSINGVRDPAKRREIEEAYSQDRLDRVRARQMGAGFDGFANDQEMLRELMRYGEKTGLTPDQVIASRNGIFLPAPARYNKRMGRNEYDEGYSLEAAEHPVHFLPPHLRHRQEIDGVLESDEQYVARLVTHISERGHISDDGEFVSPFAARGMDTRDPVHAERVAAVVSGGGEDEVAKIIIPARRSENTPIRAAYDWADAQQPSADVRYALDRQAVNELVADARKTIEDRRAVPAEHPRGGTTTVGRMEADFAGAVRQMEDTLKGLKELHGRRDSIPETEFSSRLKELSDDRSNLAQDIDELSGVLKRALEHSRESRDICQMQMSLIDPGTQLDFSGLVSLSQEIAVETDTRMAEMESQFEKLVGAISRIPDRAADLDEMAQAIQVLGTNTKNLMTQDDADNRSMMDMLAEKLEQVENNTKIRASDPHSSAQTPQRASQMIQKVLARVA